MNVSILYENLRLRVCVKCNFSEVGVGQILNMEAYKFRAVVKYRVKS